MKGIFVVFHGFAAHNGISKKIFYQCDALVHCGADTRLCYLDTDGQGRHRRMMDDAPLEYFGKGIAAKFRKRLSYRRLTEYIVREKIDFVYVRYDHNANPALNAWFRRLRELGVTVLLEIPTYPYDQEYRKATWKWKLYLCFERFYRLRMARHVDRIVTFSDCSEIFGVPTICISNGIDFSKITLKRKLNDTSGELNLIGVAEIHFWHAFDRVIEGLAAYYAAPRRRQVVFHVVGTGLHGQADALRELAERLGVADRVVFHGKRFGEELDDLFDRCDMGIASLGRHRSGITRIKTLKNREYAARGIPFVYSETDDDFDRMPYVIKAPADESPLDIGALIRFYDSACWEPEKIRASIEHTLSWDKQMETILEEVKRIKE